jgi:hypothetical protein
MRWILWLALGAWSANLPAQHLFETQTIDDSISIGYGLAIGDVDGDRRPDVLLADKKQFVWYRNSDWKRFVIAENLTESDNVCIAARDIDGDGKVEIAVGAQWSPGETSDTLKSGSVHYLVRPPDPTTKWSAIRLHHEPTVHRMKWMKIGPSEFRLIVVPLHGRGNKNGEGAGVKVLAYKAPSKGNKLWTYEQIDQSMHLTHNLELIPEGNKEAIAIGGKEGLKVYEHRSGKWSLKDWRVKTFPFGEVRLGTYGNQKFFAGIEPMHGNKVVVHTGSKRIILDSAYNQGHSLACADLFGNGHDQVVAGWREPDKNGKTGIRIFDPADASWTKWTSSWLDENGIACEDLVIADLDADGKPDVIAAGRASKNLRIYWNKPK